VTINDRGPFIRGRCSTFHWGRPRDGMTVPALAASMTEVVSSGRLTPPPFIQIGKRWSLRRRTCLHAEKSLAVRNDGRLFLSDHTRAFRMRPWAGPDSMLPIMVMVWDGPYGIAMCQNEVVANLRQGAVREPEYSNRKGYVEALF